MNITAKVYSQQSQLVHDKQTLTGIKEINAPALDLREAETVTKSETLTQGKHDLVVKLDDSKAIHVSFELSEPVNRAGLLANLKLALETGKINTDTEEPQVVQDFEKLFLSEPVAQNKLQLIEKSQLLEQIVLSKLEGESLPSLEQPKPQKLSQSEVLAHIFGPEAQIEAFEVTHFKTIDTARDVKSFVSIEDQTIKLNQSLSSALTTYVNLCPKSSQKLVQELQELHKSGGKSETPNLKAFIKYQVYKTGMHVMSEDEFNWSLKLALQARSQYPEETKGVSNEQLAKAIGQHYMCKTKLSQPVCSLLRKDRPEFVSEHLKVKPFEAQLHLSQGSYRTSEKHEPIPAIEVLYNCKLYSGQQALEAAQKQLGEQVLQAKTLSLTKVLTGKTLNPEAAGIMAKEMLSKSWTEPEVKVALKELLKSEANEMKIKNVANLLCLGNFKLTPFDPAVSELVTMQVPVIAEAPEIKLPSGVKLKLGKGAQDMGIPMTNEDGGVFRRSYNSQRVVEIGELSQEGQLQVFQMKGAGVPEYGFNFGHSGGEYLDLSTELDAASLRDFSKLVGTGKDIAPHCLGQALVSAPEHTSVVLHGEPDQRKGAITFRIDESSGGLRMENVPKPPKEVKEQTPEVSPEQPQELGKEKLKQPLKTTLQPEIELAPVLETPVPQSSSNKVSLNDLLGGKSKLKKYTPPVETPVPQTPSTQVSTKVSLNDLLGGRSKLKKYTPPLETPVLQTPSIVSQTPSNRVSLNELLSGKSKLKKPSLDDDLQTVSTPKEGSEVHLQPQSSTLPEKQGIKPEKVDIEVLEVIDPLTSSELNEEQKKKLLQDLKSDFKSETMVEQLVIESKQFKSLDSQGFNESVTTIVKNSAVANLLGIKYDDQNCVNLADLGLKGEFFDTGGINNLDSEKPEHYLFSSLTINTGVKQALDDQVISTAYKDQVIETLKTLSQKLASTEFGEGLKALHEDMQLLKPEQMQRFFAYLGDKNGQEGQSVMIAFRQGGLEGYSKVLLEHWKLHKSEFEKQ